MIANLFERRSNPKQTATNGNSDRVRSIIGPKFIDQVLYVEVYSGFCNCQLISNLLVAVTIANESEHFQFAGRKVLFAEVLSKSRRYLWWNMPTSHMH